MKKMKGKKHSMTEGQHATLPTVMNDEQIHESHHAGNKEHGMAGHMLPKGEMLNGGGQKGGAGMESNECCD